ncbi:hypothetical protein [Micavibrio aeruginosavorus]|uniref:hypothetical protein n=1 Tax=Micavibrio aeruginosavorus TaxID=349221 RepID=UPI003F4AC0C8
MMDHDTYNWVLHDQTRAGLAQLAKSVHALTAPATPQHVAALEKLALKESFNAHAGQFGLMQYQAAWQEASVVLLGNMRNNVVKCNMRLEAIGSHMASVIGDFPEEKYDAKLRAYIQYWGLRGLEQKQQSHATTNMLVAIPGMQDFAKQGARKTEIEMDRVYFLASSAFDELVERRADGTAASGDDLAKRIERLAASCDAYADQTLEHAVMKHKIAQRAVVCAASERVAKLGGDDEDVAALFTQFAIAMSRGADNDLKQAENLLRGAYFSRDVQRPAFLYTFEK